MERRVRGSILNSYMEFINKKWGKDGYNQCMSNLGLDETFKNGKYYQDEIRENILRWISREKGMEYTKECGKFIVGNLGILSWLVRFADVKTLAKKFPKNFSEVYAYGRVEAETNEENLIIIKIYDVNRIKESCNVWHGVCQGAVELTNTLAEVRKTKCAIDGDEYCEYTINI